MIETRSTRKESHVLEATFGSDCRASKAPCLVLTAKGSLILLSGPLLLEASFTGVPPDLLIPAPGFESAIDDGVSILWKSLLK